MRYCASHFDERRRKTQLAAGHSRFQSVNYLRIEFGDGQRTDAVERILQVHRGLVGSVGGDRVERVGDGDDARH